MNYIQFLQDDREDLKATINSIREELLELDRYLRSAKFHNDDYVHVSTDIMPKLAKIRLLTCDR